MILVKKLEKLGFDKNPDYKSIENDLININEDPDKEVELF